MFPSALKNAVEVSNTGASCASEETRRPLTVMATPCSIRHNFATQDLATQVMDLTLIEPFFIAYTLSHYWAKASLFFFQTSLYCAVSDHVCYKLDQIITQLSPRSTSTAMSFFRYPFFRQRKKRLCNPIPCDPGCRAHNAFEPLTKYN